MNTKFQVFSSSHFNALAWGGGIILLLLLLGKTSALGKKISATVIAFFCFAAYGISQYAWSKINEPTLLDNFIPLQLCDLAAIIAGFALLKKNYVLCELTYYWGLAATLQGLITPAIQYDFPHPTAFSFFIHHFAVVAAALYLPICDGWKPEYKFWKSPLRAWAWANVYLVIAMITNVILKTNFGFLMHKPETPSLIDHLGSWPYYLLAFEVIALAFFFILTLPFLIGRKANQKLA